MTSNLGFRSERAPQINFQYFTANAFARLCRLVTPPNPHATVSAAAPTPQGPGCAGCCLAQRDGKRRLRSCSSCAPSVGGGCASFGAIGCRALFGCGGFARRSPLHGLCMARRVVRAHVRGPRRCVSNIAHLSEALRVGAMHGHTFGSPETSNRSAPKR